MCKNWPAVGLSLLVLTGAGVLLAQSKVGNVPANHANAAETTTPAPPAKDALLTLEKSAFEAWKSHDAKFWDTYLSDKFVGYGSSGKLDKASATQEYTGARCDIKSYALSGEQLKLLGPRATLITYKTTVDGTCGGQNIPAHSWAASVYIRDGDRWKQVFHAESPVVDPAVVAANPLANHASPAAHKSKPAAQDAYTNALFTLEKSVWEAWRAHDAPQIASLTASDISFINIFGTYLPTKTDALKNWSGAGCDVKSVSVTDAAATMLSPTVGILTFNGAADGACYGQKVGRISGASIYVKGRNGWKWTFGINTPAR